MILRDDDLVRHSGRVRQSQHRFGIVAGYAGGCRERQTCGCSCGNEAPFRAPSTSRAGGLGVQPVHRECDEQPTALVC